jgi:hypothetical protein
MMLDAVSNQKNQIGSRATRGSESTIVLQKPRNLLEHEGTAFSWWVVFCGIVSPPAFETLPCRHEQIPAEQIEYLFGISI